MALCFISCILGGAPLSSDVSELRQHSELGLGVFERGPPGGEEGKGEKLTC